MKRSRGKKIGIIGVGFMGGSLALALKKNCPSFFVCGYARSKKSYDKLKRLRILDSLSTDLAEFVKSLDIVILALPVEPIIEYFQKIAPFLRDGAVVFDLGSSKKKIEGAARKYLPDGTFFVGCHPLCGSERSGAQFSDPGIYRGAACLITASPRKKHVRLVKNIWERVGCKISFMSADSHDRVLSGISHLPHIISFSLTRLIPEKYLKFSPGSFRDLTRISKSSALLWSEIIMSNKKNILNDLADFICILRLFERLIKKNGKKQIMEIIKKANIKQKRIR